MAARAALGFSVHTGWAALVAIGPGPAAALAVLDRRRVELIGDGDPAGPRFVYHAARRLPGDVAERAVRAAARRAAENARAALEAAVRDLEARDYRVVAGGLVAGGEPPAGPLQAILGSHAWVHAAEGALFREAVREASRILGIPLAEVRARDLGARAAAALGIREGEVKRLLTRVGVAAGPPWARDQKEACLAAAAALATSGSAPSPRGSRRRLGAAARGRGRRR